MKSKRILAMLLTLVMLIGVFASCGGDDVTTTPSAGEITGPISGSLAEALMNAGYKMVAKENADSATVSACGIIEKAINTASGKQILVEDDWVKRGKPIPANNKEILVGHTNRASSEAALESMTANRKNCGKDFQIIMKNDEVVIQAGSSAGLAAAAAEFVKLLAQPAGTMIGTYDSGIKEHAWEIVELGGVSLGEYTIVLPKEADETLQSAASTLKDAIFTVSGFKLEIVNDTTAAGAHELVLGDTNRPASTEAAAKLTENRPNNAYDSIIHTKGGAVALGGGTSDAVANTVTLLTSTYFKADQQAGVATLSKIFEKADISELQINGNDVSTYKIVYREGADFDTRYVAHKLQNFLRTECGYDVAIITDATAAAGKEIILGKTNRPASTALDLDKYNVKVDASSNLVIDAGHYVGLQNAFNDLLKHLEGQTGDVLKIANNYGGASTVTNVALTWDVPDSNLDLNVEGDGKYTLVWNDEFEGVYDEEEGRTRIDYEKWSGHANMSMPDTELTFDEKTVRIENGTLVMVTDVTDKVSRKYITHYSVTTHDTMNWSGGFMEMKAKVPFYGMGEWPSYWSVGGTAVLFLQEYAKTHAHEPGYYTGYGVEVDFFEIFSSKDTVVANLHKWFRNDIKLDFNAPDRVQLSGVDQGAHESGTKSYKFKAKNGMTVDQVAREYHTYGFLWTPTVMSFSVDNDFYFAYSLLDKDQVGSSASFNPTYKNPATGESRTFDMSGYTYDNLALGLILNNMFFPEAYCAGSGSWAAQHVIKPKNDDVLFPMLYTVDYIRLYQTEGDRIYTPDFFGGTQMFTASRFPAEYLKEDPAPAA